ncbi:hypothetical protein TTHERM_00994210 (macronuclear) [Tetrahymena thermophila SB210]|uniref:Transmembrane protein n=1 Tax=Tetrahymena thermophila (strain SB210) TaxID=312017 RepID=Q247S6_TETTS|nr:hypothetical protein TTHERM_00994210 [Tetrahymena thermophila SB210]EAS04024.1 hypothetical protein TTHERM_00994210 [Tetrahymena thermophila SB210]|eukprot:XP_001024269.1 hypothetical protein TTHERM_00994210 [Tetrahymena thermophila SB210]
MIKGFQSILILLTLKSSLEADEIDTSKISYSKIEYHAYNQLNNQGLSSKNKIKMMKI